MQLTLLDLSFPDPIRIHIHYFKNQSSAKLITIQIESTQSYVALRRLKNPKHNISHTK